MPSDETQRRAEALRRGGDQPRGGDRQPRADGRGDEVGSARSPIGRARCSPSSSACGAGGSADGGAGRRLGRAPWSWRGRPGESCRSSRASPRLLCGLGLADALVGITVYCVEPRDVGQHARSESAARRIPTSRRSAGSSPISSSRTSKRTCATTSITLRSWSIPVWVTYPRTVAEGIRLIAELGSVTGTERARPRHAAASIEPLYERVVTSAAAAAAGRRLLPDLARAVHDDQPRHATSTTCSASAGTKRVRRSPGALSDGDAGRGRGAAAGGDPAPGRAVSIQTRARGRLRGICRTFLRCATGGSTSWTGSPSPGTGHGSPDALCAGCRA